MDHQSVRHLDLLWDPQHMPHEEMPTHVQLPAVAGRQHRRTDAEGLELSPELRRGSEAEDHALVQEGRDVLEDAGAAQQQKEATLDQTCTCSSERLLLHACRAQRCPGTRIEDVQACPRKVCQSQLGAWVCVSGARGSLLVCLLFEREQLPLDPPLARRHAVEDGLVPPRELLDRTVGSGSDHELIVKGLVGPHLLQWGPEVRILGQAVQAPRIKDHRSLRKSHSALRPGPGGELGLSGEDPQLVGHPRARGRGVVHSQ
mmetsp:Transcript_76712/g.225207  ORF Transcript_76712/g.225207 Transcript_76712/m.225207 type:complete len:259 (+) Transcript_76712:134-910(+)